MISLVYNILKYLSLAEQQSKVNPYCSNQCSSFQQQLSVMNKLPPFHVLQQHYSDGTQKPSPPENLCLVNLWGKTMISHPFSNVFLPTLQGLRPFYLSHLKSKKITSVDLCSFALFSNCACNINYLVCIIIFKIMAIQSPAIL